jgi:four helix bundle protein
LSKYEDLEVWKKSHELVLEVYRQIDKFPKDERFRLSDQLSRAVTSIPTNICEGTGRSTNRDFLHFLHISRGSLQETKYLLLLSKDLNYITEKEYNILIDKCTLIGKLLNSLIKKIGENI